MIISALCSKNVWLLDEPVMAFSLIPQTGRANESQQFTVSRISDRLLSLCASKLIAIPRFIGLIGNNFHSFESRARVIEISPMDWDV
jgi:hypothetical protein